jgi:hypothetical protein
LDMNSCPGEVDQFAITHNLKVIWPPRAPLQGPPERVLSGTEIKTMSTAIFARLHTLNGLTPPKTLSPIS